MSDETSIQKPETETVPDPPANIDEETALQPAAADEKKTPKRTPKRRSFIERAQRESEELVRNMGGSLELEGGRRTRSSTRGTPTRGAETVTPPPSKKARTSPAVAKSGGRGRGARKLDVGGEEPVAQESEQSKAEQTEEEQESKTAKADETKDEEPAQNEDKKEETKASDESSTDQPDAVKEPAVVAEKEQQNNIDHGKANVVDSETNEPKAEEVAAIKESPKDAESSAEDAVKMDVDTEKPVQQEQTKADSASSTTDKAAEPEILKAEEKKPEEKKSAAEVVKRAPVSTKEPTPEPMDVDASSQSTTDAVNAIPADECPPVVVAADPDSVPSLSAADKIAEAVKEDSQTDPTDSNATAVDSTPNPAANNALNTAVANASSNDISKQAPIADVNAVAVEPAESVAAIKEPLINSEPNKNEQNDNGEPKIVNSTTEDGDNHATPQACN
ncbi:neurofilament medium polypeptide [Scaptodrosophila lebanonensis]|uniref:Neurofilament medium polypeptide n=1 Tax=Drosophila lebanonensis TaxID=7225 RepID=A0A6J2SY37_DROLE|nr:neurofilament medium polypeptide [Scaptodrosophila lebanonensis]